MTPTEMRVQRDQALACLILALCAALAVFLSVFGRREALVIADARRAVALHEGLLSESAATLHRNQGALAAARAALSDVEKARQR